MNDSEEKILVCVGIGDSGEEIVRAAWRRAGEFHAKLLAVHVETPESFLVSESDREKVLDSLRLAGKLGAETIILNGRNAAQMIIDLARERNVTRIVAGKPKRSWIRNLLYKSPAYQLIGRSGKIDVEITSGVPEKPGEPVEVIYKPRSKREPWSDYGTALLLLGLATGLCYLMLPFFALANLIMVYLLAVMVTAIECGRGPAIMASAVSVLSFDFFFVPPRYTFTVDDAQYFVTFAVMFVVALAISHLTVRMRKQTETARLQERQATAMHELARQLASSRSVEDTLKIGVGYLEEIFDSHTVILLPGIDRKLVPVAGDASSVFLRNVTKELQLTRKAFESGKEHGLGALAGTDGELLNVPLKVAGNTLGVLTLRPEDPERFLLSGQRHLLESLAKQIALSLEGEYLEEGFKIAAPDFSGLTKSDRPDTALEG